MSPPMPPAAVAATAAVVTYKDQMRDYVIPATITNEDAASSLRDVPIARAVPMDMSSSSLADYNGGVAVVVPAAQLVTRNGDHQATTADTAHRDRYGILQLLALEEQRALQIMELERQRQSGAAAPAGEDSLHRVADGGGNNDDDGKHTRLQQQQHHHRCKATVCGRWFKYAVTAVSCLVLGIIIAVVGMCGGSGHNNCRSRSSFTNSTSLTDAVTTNSLAPAAAVQHTPGPVAAFTASAPTTIQGRTQTPTVLPEIPTVKITTTATAIAPTIQPSTARPIDNSMAPTTGRPDNGGGGGVALIMSQIPPRTQYILDYINSVTSTDQTLRYPASNGTAEGRAIMWLIDDAFNADLLISNPIELLKSPAQHVERLELTFLQRYVLKALWLEMPDDEHDPERYDFGGECVWSSVTCDETGRVIRVAVTDQNVQGSIPADLVLLSHLQSLELGGNDFTGTVPSTLTALTALTHLSLEHNRLTGTMPFCVDDNTTVIIDTNNGVWPSSLTELSADCGEVSCRCCSTCCIAQICT